MTVSAVTDATFEQDVLQSTQPVLVDFWAEWCGPCKAMAPALDQVAHEMQDKIKIVKLDVDTNPTAMGTYGVRAMPTLILFKDGKVVARHVGAVVQKVKLEAQINDFLAIASKSAAGQPRATTFKLANGMDVVVIPDPRAPAVSHMVCYKFGVAEAPQGQSGAAAVLEHLMAKSVERSAVGEIVMSQPNWNVTAYHQRIAKDQLQTLMQMEARRVTQERFTDAEVAAAPQIIAEQLHLVWQLAEQMRAALSGTEKDADPSCQDVTGFYERHYVPNNAVLVVCGDVTPDEVKQLAEATYGKIPAGAEGKRRPPPPQPQHGVARRVILKDRFVGSAAGIRANPQFSRAYYVPSYVTAGPGVAAALELLAQILQESPGRLPKLLERKLSIVGIKTDYAGSAVVSGTLDITLSTIGNDIGAIEAGVDAVLDDIRANGVSELELESAKTALTASDDEYAIDNPETLARHYGTAVAVGRSIEDVEGWPAELAKVTTDDIKRVANAYLDPARSVTGWLIPEPVAAQDAQLAEAV